MKWLQINVKHYNAKLVTRDVVAGFITACIAIPQSMAYAQLAGFPPESGLYSALLPPVLYAIFGSSKTLVVGPAALLCLMVANTVARFSPQNADAYFMLSINLTLLTAFWLIVLSICRLGSLANFLSKPVITGFTSASAMVIIASQFSLLLGISSAKPEAQTFVERLISTPELISQVQVPVLYLSIVSLAFLWLWQRYFPSLLTQLGVRSHLAFPLTKLAPVILVCVSVYVGFTWNLAARFDIAIVGYLPQSLPTLSVAVFRPELWQELAIPSFSIALISFITSISTGSLLASKKHERINTNRELFALGAANVGSALIGTFVLAGSLSRSVLNFASGARTQMANVFSAMFTLCAVLWVSAYFSFLPQAILAVIVMYSILPMLGFKQLFSGWSFNKADTLSRAITFIAVLVVGVEAGIWTGICCSLILLIHRSTHPHIAEVGLSANGYFRNIKRLNVKTIPNTVFLRIDENLYFANVNYIEDYALQRCADKPRVKHLVLILSSVNAIDESALEVIERLSYNLKEQGILLHLSNIKGIVLDQLRQSNLQQHIAPGKLFYTANDAMKTLGTAS